MFYPIEKKKALALDETEESFLTTLIRPGVELTSKKISLIEILGTKNGEKDEYFYMVKSTKMEKTNPNLLNNQSPSISDDEDEENPSQRFSAKDFIFEV